MGRGASSRGNFFGDRGSFNGGRSSGGRGQSSNGTVNGGRVQCQLCTKFGHMVQDYCYRFDQLFRGPSHFYGQV